jgi:folate-dependent tRNA-U54 methylase TrmFO/GidA
MSNKLLFFYTKALEGIFQLFKLMPCIEKARLALRLRKIKRPTMFRSANVLKAHLVIFSMSHLTINGPHI